MKKNVIFILNIPVSFKPNRTNTYHYSIASWQQWANRNNCEVVVMDKELADPAEMYICWQRYYLFDLLENSGIDYDQVLMVDTDTIVHPNCPDFFKLTNGNYAGVHNRGSYSWVLRAMENYSKYAFQGMWFDFMRYINTGFQVVNIKHKDFFRAIVNFYNQNKDHLLKMQSTFHTGTDQTCVNFLREALDIDMTILPYEYNMADLARNESLTLLDDGTPLFTKFGWVYHFNAIPDNKDSMKKHYWMEYN